MNDSHSPALTFQTVGFIGLGLIGGSLAKLIRQELPETRILAVDTETVTSLAIDQGIIDGACTSIEVLVDELPDLIVIATHISQSFQVLKTLAEAAQGKTLSVMDLGSTKQSISQLAESLPGGLDFIGGHPLAGREISGFENSLPSLFLNKRFLLTPCGKTSPELKKRVSTWLSILKTIPSVMTPEAHDKLMALVSHFPQFYAVALANLLDQNTPDETLHFLGGGIDDQMRLMASPYPMWKDVFAENRENVDAILSQFICILQTMQQSLRSETLESQFQNSQKIYSLYQAHKKT